jgi:hypothetical protein
VLKHVIEQRKVKGLPCKAPFEVSFKVVRERAKIERHSHISDYTFWLDDAGNTKLERRLRKYCISWSWGNPRRCYWRARDSLYRAIRDEFTG